MTTKEIFLGLLLFWALALAIALQCGDCDQLNEGRSRCLSARGEELTCEGPIPQPRFKEVDDQTDIITVADGVGDLSILNKNYHKFYKFVNHSTYATRNETVDLTFALGDLVDFKEAEVPKEQYIKGDIFFEFYDLDANGTANMNIFENKITIKKQETQLEITIADSNIVSSALSVYFICARTKCQTSAHLYNYDAVRVDELIVDLHLEDYEDTEENIRKFVLSHDEFEYARLLLEDTSVFENDKFKEMKKNDDWTSLQLLARSAQQKYYYAFHEMVSLIELNELTLSDIASPYTRSLLQLTREIINLKATTQALPRIDRMGVIDASAIELASPELFPEACREVPKQFFQTSQSSCDYSAPKQVCLQEGGPAQKIRMVYNFNDFKLMLEGQSYSEIELQSPFNQDAIGLFDKGARVIFPETFKSQFKFLIKRRMKLTGVWLLSNSVQNVYDIAEEGQISLSNLGVTTTASSPKPAEVSIDGSKYYGVEFSEVDNQNWLVIQSSIPPTNNPLIDFPHANSINNCRLDYLPVAWSADSKIAAYVDNLQTDKISVFVKSTENTTSQVRVKSNIELFKYFSSASDVTQVVDYSPMLDDIEQELISQKERLSGLEDRVTVLEDIIEKESEPSFWDYLASINDVVGLGQFFYSSSKTIFATTKSAFRFLKSKSAKFASVGEELASRLRLRKKSTSAYNPVEAINNGAVFNYISGYRPVKAKKGDAKFESFDRITDYLDETNNLHIDIHNLMQSNSGAYTTMSSRILDQVDTSSLGIDKLGFNTLYVHKSPIEALKPIGSKFIADNFPTKLTENFLSNRVTRYPFHTSFSSYSVETNSKRQLLLVRRYGGIGDISTVGPTNGLKDVKVGYLKSEFFISPTGKLQLKTWRDTEKFEGKMYSEQDVDQLFRSFVSPKTYDLTAAELTTDEKWKYINSKVQKKFNKRDVIDSTMLSNPLYQRTLDSLFDYNVNFGSFNYNLLSRNCQGFVKSYAQLVTKGITNTFIKDRDFSAFIAQFRENAARYLKESLDSGLVKDTFSKITYVLNKACKFITY